MACNNCIHLTEHRVCALFDAEPPADAINQDIGCEALAWDGIPF